VVPKLIGERKKTNARKDEAAGTLYKGFSIQDAIERIRKK
jgi:hypothetical protein